jgi:hypothetical protein
MKWIIILPYQNRKMSYTNNFENLEKISDNCRETGHHTSKGGILLTS